MKKNKGRVVIETRERIPRRNRATKRFAESRAGAFSQFDITLDCMCAAIDFGDAIVKKERAFARIAHSVNLLRTADLRDKRTAQQALKIECEIGMKRAGFLQPREHALRRAEAAKFPSRKHADMVYVGISSQQRYELRVNDPRDLGVGMRIANQRHRRNRVDDVAERTRLDDQDRFQISRNNQ